MDSTTTLGHSSTHAACNTMDKDPYTLTLCWQFESESVFFMVRTFLFEVAAVTDSLFFCMPSNGFHYNTWAFIHACGMQYDGQGSQYTYLEFATRAGFQLLMVMVRKCVVGPVAAVASILLYAVEAIPQQDLGVHPCGMQYD
jgi:hypothetical protein